MDADSSQSLLDEVEHAVASRQPVNIVSGNSKHWLGVTTPARSLLLREHTGVVNYEPTELVVSVRCGTLLEDLNTTLAEHGQMLPFEPPVLPGATIGGVLACGLSGPRRPFAGSARDHILGVRIINGRAQDLRFGGEVMKNVAGYDVSRLQVGALGTLGVMLDVSMKVLPVAEVEITLCQNLSTKNDLSNLIKLARQPVPLSAAMVLGDKQFVRLSGSESAVQAAVKALGGECPGGADIFWQSINDHSHAFFQDERALWRISVADFTPPLDLAGDWLLDWGGAQRWLKTELPAEEIFTKTAAVHGHATYFYSGAAARLNAAADALADTDAVAGDVRPVFQPLSGAMRDLQARVRDSFDPLRLFNPGRFHPELDEKDSPSGTATALPGASVDDRAVAGSH